MKFFINAGHAPGIDPGAINHGLNQQEAQIAKQVSELLVKFLRDAGHRVMSVQDDNLMYVTFRSNSYKPDVFISIHCNAYDGYLASNGVWKSGTVSGTEVHVYSRNSKCLILAREISKAISNRLGIIDRGVKFSPEFWVLRDTEDPAMLIELGFIDNDEECQLLVDNIYNIASAIFSVLREGVIQ